MGRQTRQECYRFQSDGIRHRGLCPPHPPPSTFPDRPKGFLVSRPHSAHHILSPAPNQSLHSPSSRPASCPPVPPLRAPAPAVPPLLLPILQACPEPYPHVWGAPAQCPHPLCSPHMMHHQVEGSPRCWAADPAPSPGIGPRRPFSRELLNE